jgi:hypothetical protein
MKRSGKPDFRTCAHYTELILPGKWSLVKHNCTKKRETLRFESAKSSKPLLANEILRKSLMFAEKIPQKPGCNTWETPEYPGN